MTVYRWNREAERNRLQAIKQLMDRIEREIEKEGKHAA